MQNKPTFSHRYDDIIELSHHVSTRRVHMSGVDRAAQFAPFAALTGHDAAIHETARQTDSCTELTEDQKAVLDRTLQYLRDHLGESPEVTITYFVPDNKKPGGAHVSTTGRIKKFIPDHNLIIMDDWTLVTIDSILDIQLLAK